MIISTWLQSIFAHWVKNPFLTWRVAWDSLYLEGKHLLNLLFLIFFFPDGLSVQTVAGMLYNPFSGYWHWIENTSLNYAAHAVKHPHPGPAELVFEGEADVPAKASTNPGVREEPKEWIVSEDDRNTVEVRYLQIRKLYRLSFERGSCRKERQ